MCGIAGLIAPAAGGEALAARLTGIRDHMRTRGPDDAGLELLDDGRVGLAHRRLSIIDLSPAGHQPMPDASGTLRIVFNGEIYNYRALRDELAAAGATFRSGSDTEVILELYRREGRAMLPRLRGMFALAIWDERDCTLLLARDTHGIKPLYYRTAPDFAFASQVRALLADPHAPRRLDPVGAYGFAIWGAVPEPHTLVAGIAALPAGHSLLVEADGRAGAPEPFLTLPQVLAEPAGEPAPDLAAALADSVRHHMIADVEVGCFLSAGVDSGAILGLMRDAGASRVRAITLRFAEFAGTARDEVPLAAEVARLYGAEHHVVTIDRADFEASLPAILAAMDQPSIDGVNSWFVSRAAARAGLKVALSGLGGDELLAGYSTFRTVPTTHRLARAAWAVPPVGALAQRLAARLGRGKAAHVMAHARHLPGAYLARRAMRLPEQLGELLAPDTAAAARAGWSPTDEAAAILAAVPGDPVTQVSALESTHYMRNQLLRDSDWAGMAHSLEIRLPLVDVALSRAVAPHLPHLRPGDGKRLLANAPSQPLPAAVVERRKTGFGIPVDRWSGTAARLADGWAKRVLDDYCAAERIEP